MKPPLIINKFSYLCKGLATKKQPRSKDFGPNHRVITPPPLPINKFSFAKD